MSVGTPPAAGQRSRPSRRIPTRRILALAVATLAVLAVVARALTEHTPPLRIQRALAAYVRLPGVMPTPAWPRQGEAAVEVQGVGTFGSHGGQRPVPIASVAKVMTAYLTLLTHPLAAGRQGFEMTISQAEVEEQEQRAALGESTVAVRVGERLSERQALEALLIPSANNVAALLAAYDSGSVAEFVTDMNQMAKRLGMTSTMYTDPSGFEDSTESTASDQLLLAARAMRLRTFAEIVDQPSATLPVAGDVANFDGLVGYDGYVGVKTGSDRAAGGCLVFAKHVLLAGHPLTVLGVVLGQRGPSLIEAALRSARRLGDSTAAMLRVATVLPAGTAVLSLTSTDGRAAEVITAQPLRAIGWSGQVIPLRMNVRSTLKRVRAREPVATVANADAPSATVQALAGRALAPPSFGWRLLHVHA